jgi:chemotaxis protein CheD
MALASQRPVRTINVIQGEHAISTDPEAMLTTVLGSCVATCMYDPVARVGGMNHFLLPGDQGNASSSMSYGLNAMELLINGLLKEGAMKGRLQAKIFGGARMMKGLSDIGQKNSEFARTFLHRENIPCISDSLGGEMARRIRFWPTDGRARQLLLGKSETIDRNVVEVKTPVITEAVDDIELF